MSSSTALEAIYATGHWLLDQRRYADAACMFRVMMSNAPSDERGWLALGACHEAVGELGIALALYMGACDTTSPAIRSHIARARALSALGREDDAAEALDLAERLATEHDDDELARIARAERVPT